ncbi:MAG: redoxin domain-containing protein [Bacteroides sp.]|nr:redoxin domain-containing protein [Bacteroides sp.]
MKRFWIFTSFVLIFALAVWMFSTRIDSQAQASNSTPQLLEATNTSSHLSTSDLKGKYVLVNFWDSHNAVSRIAAGEYDRYYRTHRNNNLRLLSVNTDDNRRLFDEIVRRDGLDTLTQFHIADVKARGISPGYHPESGYSSYLLNPSGKIIAVNPTVQAVNKIVSTN